MDKLEELRETLNYEVVKNIDCLANKEVVELSQELDEVIVAAQREMEENKL